jgi:hypothetical protein
VEAVINTDEAAFYGHFLNCNKCQLGHNEWDVCEEEGFGLISKIGGARATSLYIFFAEKLGIYKVGMEA